MFIREFKLLTRESFRHCENVKTNATKFNEFSQHHERGEWRGARPRGWLAPRAGGRARGLRGRRRRFSPSLRRVRIPDIKASTAHSPARSVCLNVTVSTSLVQGLTV